MSNNRPKVLIIDDEPDLADLYAAWLTDDYDVVTAYGGEKGIDAMDEDVDIALIDRLMPDMSGDEVLGRIREAGYDSRVAMVTAVEPDFDIIEMGFDDYLVKPVRREGLHEAVEGLLNRASYGTQLREYYSLVSKQAALEAQKTEHELSDSDAYAELVEEIARLNEEISATTAEFSPADFEAELRNLEDS